MIYQYYQVKEIYLVEMLQLYSSIRTVYMYVHTLYLK